MNEKNSRKEQIRTLVNRYYNQFEILHRDTESELYNKALLRYLNNDMTIEEIIVDMQKIVSERLKLQNENQEIMLRSKQKEISDFIDEIAKKVPGVPQDTIDKVKMIYYKDNRNLADIKAAIIEQVNNYISAIEHEEKDKQRVADIINKAPKGTVEQDYIIYFLDENNNPVIESAKIDSVEKTKYGVHDTMKVSVNDGEFIGYLKSLETSRQNSYEIVMSSIGNMLNVPIARSYRVINDGKEVSIISRNVCNNLEEELIVFQEWDKSFILKLKEMGVDITPLLTLRKEAFTLPSETNDYKCIIDYNLAVMQAGLSKEEYQIARKQFLQSIVFDYLVNQVDRNASNYGIIVDKSTGEGKSLAPLFDNSAVSKPGLTEDEMSFWNVKINRHQMLECVYQHYYEDIQSFSSNLLANKDAYGAQISQISNEYLDYYESKNFIGKVKQNYRQIMLLEQQKQLEIQKKGHISESSHQVAMTEMPHHMNAEFDSNFNNTPTLEQEGPKLVRKLPQTTKNNNDSSSSNNDGKINLILIIIISLIAICFAIAGMYIIYKLK